MVRVREMTEADIEGVSTVRVRGWRAAYAGMVPASYLEGMTVEEDARSRRSWFRRSSGRVLNLVAVNDRAEVVGWGCLGPERDEASPGVGEVYALYVHPDLTGHGIGTQLVRALHSRAVERGFDTLTLWVFEDNLRARRFYASHGYVADGGTRRDTFGAFVNGVVTELRYRRTGE
ncbi:GNAT family N-acetyltransferase [Streptomyces sp. NPDC005438]|uniref:GNAT family N-acetyltransferase n=1 Tax=Streptomyces sp. NPDC005438 TaxID=3156880 RepID=UPI00339F27D7